MAKRVEPGRSGEDRNNEQQARLRPRAGASVGTGQSHEEDTVSSTDTYENQQRSKDASADLGDAIGSQLRTAYSELVNQPVPDKFMMLLEQLKKRENDGKERKS